MNKLACFVGLALLTTLNAHAAIVGAPFIPEADKRFDILENPASVQLVGALKGEKGNSGNNFVSHHAKETALSVVHATGSDVKTGIHIPAGAIIERAFALVDSAMLPGAAGTKIQFGCNSSSDLLAATDESGVAAGSIYGLIPVGSPSTMVYTSAGCDVTYQISVGASTQGKIELFIDYVVAK